MDQIIVQLPAVRAHRFADVDVTVNGEKKNYRFRVEVFRWDDWRQPAEARASALKRIIDNYDSRWQMVHIGSASDTHVPITFRKIS